MRASKIVIAHLKASLLALHGGTNNCPCISNAAAVHALIGPSWRRKEAEGATRRNGTNGTVPISHSNCLALSFVAAFGLLLVGYHINCAPKS